MKLRTGKTVPFLNKNIPKRKYTKSYKYKTPIPKEAEDDLASSFANISLCDNQQSNNQSMLLTPRKPLQPAKRKSLIFDDDESTDEDDISANDIQIYNLSQLPFDQNEESEEPEVDPKDQPEFEVVKVGSAVSNKVESSTSFADAVPISDSDNSEDDIEDMILHPMENDLIVFSSAEDKTNSDDSDIRSGDFEAAAKEEDDISDAIPVIDTSDDESEDDEDDNEIERIFFSSTPSQLRVGSVISFLQRSMQDLRSN